MGTIDQFDGTEIVDVIPEVGIEYSLQSEIERVQETLRELDWFKEHGYAPDLGWPKGFNPDSASIDDVGGLVEEEYVEDNYIPKAEKVRALIQAHGGKFFLGLKRLGMDLPSSYVIRFTRYGTAGSYYPPDTIVLNIVRRPDPIRTIFHEIVHLAVESLVVRHKLDQLTKERIVDTVLARIMDGAEGFVRVQADPPHSKEIANLFDQHFPDIAKICSLLADIIQPGKHDPL